MSRNNSAGAFQGFSVFQPALGSTLQWLPALGTYELEEMIHTFLPGPASIQDKRAHISMDFYEFARQTGETFKFYPVYSGSFAATATATDSPASSSAMQDSGYGSSFNVSPVVSNMSPWTPSLSASTPASTASDSRTKSRSGPSQRNTSTSSRQQQLDFSNHPGMRILTKDGRDITNSASRGCKSKEQRDHAHLMRIIKACEACRKKKIRCDPSHKKRTSSQAQPSRPDAKQTKKTRIATQESPAPQHFSFEAPSSLDSTPLFELAATPAGAFEGLNENPDDFWQQFVHFDDQELNYPGAHDYFLDPAGHVTSSYGSSSVSPYQSMLLSTTPGLFDNYGVLPDPASQEPALPYLNPGDSYGTNYQDFSLYSPSPSSDLLDEEPQYVRKPRRQGQQDNMLESALQHTTPEPCSIGGHMSSCDGQGHEHVDSLQTNVSDGAHVNLYGHARKTDYSVNELHGFIATTANTDKNAAVGGQARPQPSHALYVDSSGTSRASAGEHVSVQSPDAGVQTTAVSGITRYITASGSLVHRDDASALITGRLSNSCSGDTPAPLPHASYVNSVCAGTLLTHAAPNASRHARTPGEQPSAAASDVVHQSAFAPALEQQASSLALRRGVFTRSAFVLEPNDGGTIVDAGTCGAPHAQSELSTSPSKVASLVLPPPTRQDISNSLSEGDQPWTTTLDVLLNVCLVSCLLTLLVRWASLSWQLELLIALGSFSVSSCGRLSQERGSDGFRSAAAKSAAELRRCSPKDDSVGSLFHALRRTLAQVS